MGFMFILLTLLYLLKGANNAVVSNGKIEWVSVPSSQLNSVFWHPDGIEKNGSLWTFLCRSIYKGGQYTGKLLFMPRENPNCCFGHSGQEISEFNFEVIF